MASIREIVAPMLEINAGAYSFEAGNVRQIASKQLW